MWFPKLAFALLERVLLDRSAAHGELAQERALRLYAEHILPRLRRKYG